MNMKKIYALFISLFIFFSASAQWTQITHSTLGGTVEYNGIVYTGSSVVMATNGGIYRSVDNGVTWNLSVAGLDTLNLSVNNIAFIAERNELWACSNGNVFKSVDDGILWNKVNLTGLTGMGWTNQLGRVGSRLIITHSVWDNDLGRNINSLAYSDDGINWTDGPVIDDSGNNIYFEFVNEHNDKWLLFVERPGSSGSKLWYTKNGSTVDNFPLTGLTPGIEIDVEDLSIDPTGNNLFCIDRDALQIFWFDNVNNTWEEKMNGIGVEGLTLNSIFSVHSLEDITFASALFTDESSSILIKFYASIDFGNNWTEITNPGVELPTFEGGTMIKAGGGRLIGSYFNNLMAYSDNNGQTWTKITQVYGGDYDFLVTLSGGTIFAKAPGEMKGLIKSIDNGNTWTVQNGDLPKFVDMLYFIDAIWPGGPTTMYLTLRKDPFDEKQYLYKSTNSGVNWTEVITPDSYYKIFVGNYGAGNPIIWFGEEDRSGTYQFTTDGGANWVDITPAIDALNIDKVMGIKGNGSLMILFGQVSDQIRVYISADDGSNFTDITGTIDNPNYEIIVANRWDWRKQPSAISGFSADGSNFIIAVKYKTVYPFEIVFFKLNSTQTDWEQISISGIKFPYDVEWHALKQIQGVWYFVTPAGVYASIDNCASWLRVWNNQGLVQGLLPRSFAAGNNMLFMGTEDAGLWKAALYEPEIITNDASEITEESAKSGGAITATGGLPFIDKGICWATHTAPTTSDNNLSAGNSWSDFVATMTALSPNTTYYVRAFAVNPIGLAYGNEISFKTQIASMIETESIKELIVYPNPATDVLNIRAEREGEMLLLDITGRQVLREALYTGTNMVMVDKLPAGIYILKIKYLNGDVKTMRVIIK